MIRMKLILLGNEQVGKTSLIARWVMGIFSEKYLTTIGVKIDKKELLIDDTSVVLQIWDLSGEQVLSSTALAYIRNAQGCLLVADGTRAETLDVALGLGSQVTAALGRIPFVLALNKNDLEDQWKIPEEALSKIEQSGIYVFKTSAKSGNGVEEAFQFLARRMLELSLRKSA